MKENQRRQILSLDEYNREETVEEPCDKVKLMPYLKEKDFFCLILVSRFSIRAIKLKMNNTRCHVTLLKY